MTIEFFVPGTVRTAGSKSAFKGKDGSVHVTHSGKYTKEWMNTVRYFALQAMNRGCVIAEPVRLSIDFRMARPQGHFGTGRNAGKLKDSAPFYCAKKPDLTKLTRAVEDAMTGIIWRDDALVISQTTTKRYVCNSEPCGAQIKIETLE